MNRAQAGLIFVDTSTISPRLSKRVAEAAKERGVLYLRMPVSGNPILAREGRLTALVSGPEDAWRQVQPLVASFTAASRYVGDSDQARYMKLVINLLVANLGPLMAEALTLGRKGGLDWAVMIDALAASPLASPWLETKFAALKARDFTATFPPRMMLKDVDLMLDAGRDCDVPLLMTSVTRQILQALTTEFFADEDFFVTIKALERQAGLSTDL